ncbi:FAD-dependent oxidoreductase [Mycolicibacterium sp. GCM10028919]|uniref:FAD-dependent oxidoreductase n=1 Tax=Mycolicibacterium sp. GCM10028919 TaxID=3273401 RepID=UPI00361C9D7C
MPHVITQSCCKDASCVAVCPVDCIRPARDEVFVDTSMLFIDPGVCIDCGACVDACPVDAIQYDADLPASSTWLEQMNADYFRSHPLHSDFSSDAPAHPGVDAGALRVAIVGAGPAACYAAAELLESDGVEVALFERLPTPYGLIRAGVAPDHQDTKSVTRLFERAFDSDRLDCHLNVAVGRDITHADLLAHHHAVVYAVGASASRRLGIPGEDLAGCVAAADFVGWYNGHPDHADREFDLAGPTVVIVGNGNVSLDVARMLVLDARSVAVTDTADHALLALDRSTVEEVVILARRGPRHAAFSVAEFAALGELPRIDVVIESDDLAAEAGDDVETTWKLKTARAFAARSRTEGNKRIVFRFGVDPVRLRGSEAVDGIEIETPAGTEVIDTALVIRSIGYRGEAVTDLPFDDDAAVVPNDRGRVLGADGGPLDGVYVTGWIKRGARGVIGSNRTCAKETVDRLWSDHDAGRLTRDVRGAAAVRNLLRGRSIEPVDWDGWRRIDAAERDAVAATGRPRRKLTALDELVVAASPRPE